MTHSSSSSLTGLPAATFGLAPELARLVIADTPRSDCDRCPMGCGPDELPAQPFRFHAEVRCCTYHPRLTNWQVGQILRSGGEAAALIRQRMASGGGLSAYGIQPPRHYTARVKELGPTAFGREPELRCPYWVGGDLACGIWAHRTGVCRTWFCRHEDGPRSLEFWKHFRDVLKMLEEALMWLCLEDSACPEEDPGIEGLAAWFVRCAEIVDEATPEQLANLRTPRVVEELEKLLEVSAAEGQSMPALLGPQISSFSRGPEGVTMIGYSVRDPLVVPSEIFELLTLMDGHRTWRVALGEANAVLESPIPASVIEQMYRRGLLEPLPASVDAAQAASADEGR